MERVTAISRLREPMTIAEFLDWENHEDEKYESFDGAIRMMTGGSANHVAITDNARAALRRIAAAPAAIGSCQTSSPQASNFPTFPARSPSTRSTTA